MKRSCSYCGRIHPQGFNCPMKPKKIKQRTEIEKFRSSIRWQKKRAYIAARDLHLCRVCLENGIYSQDIQVHHITPLAVDFELRLDDDNLISLCAKHHEEAERGDIPPDVLRALAKEPPPGQ